MPWFRVDDGFESHPKVLRLGKDCLPAVGLWNLSGTWSAHQLTDGVLPDAVIDPRDPKHRYAKRLVEVGLWHAPGHDCPDCPQIDEGYVFHQWGEHQPSAAEVKDLRRKRAEAGRAGGRAKARNTPSKPLASARPALKQSSTPTRPDPLGTTEVSLNPPSGDARETAGEPGPTERLLAEYVRGVGGKSPVTNDLGRQIARMVADGIGEADIRAGLTAWRDKGNHPTSLPSFVDQHIRTRNGHGRPDNVRPITSTTDQRVEQGLALVAKYKPEDAS